MAAQDEGSDLQTGDPSFRGVMQNSYFTSGQIKRTNLGEKGPRVVDAKTQISCVEFNELVVRAKIGEGQGGPRASGDDHMKFPGGVHYQECQCVVDCRDVDSVVVVEDQRHFPIERIQRI